MTTTGLGGSFLSAATYGAYKIIRGRPITAVGLSGMVVVGLTAGAAAGMMDSVRSRAEVNSRTLRSVFVLRGCFGVLVGLCVVVDLTIYATSAHDYRLGIMCCLLRSLPGVLASRATQE